MCFDVRDMMTGELNWPDLVIGRRFFWKKGTFDDNQAEETQHVRDRSQIYAAHNLLRIQFIIQNTSATFAFRCVKTHVRHTLCDTFCTISLRTYSTHTCIIHTVELLANSWPKHLSPLPIFNSKLKLNTFYHSF